MRRWAIRSGQIGLWALIPIVPLLAWLHEGSLVYDGWFDPENKVYLPTWIVWVATIGAVACIFWFLRSRRRSALTLGAVLLLVMMLSMRWVFASLQNAEDHWGPFLIAKTPFGISYCYRLGAFTFEMKDDQGRVFTHFQVWPLSFRQSDVDQTIRLMNPVTHRDGWICVGPPPPRGQSSPQPNPQFAFPAPVPGNHH